jgi:hypothetical protein
MTTPRRDITVRRFTSHAEADEADRAYWLQLSPAERVALVWPLTIQAWQFKDPTFRESRLRRDVVRLVRGGN